MNFSVNSFKESYIQKVPYSYFLHQLGIEKLPNFILVNFDFKSRLICIQLKSTSNNINHLVFKIPFKEEDLNFYKSHPKLDYLNNRYNLYSIFYKSQIKEYVKKEKQFLNTKLPNILLHTRIRVKSFPSYQKKLNDRIKEGKSLLIDDVIGERIVIDKVNNSDNPYLLKTACYKVSKVLDEYRKNYTNFRIKPIKLSTPHGFSSKDYISKDYISHPKASGYQSLHIIAQNITNPDFTYETQIRTCYMERDLKSNNKVSHLTYKSRYFDDTSILKVPKYIEVSNFKDKNNEPLVYEVPIKYAFQHYYKEDIDKYYKELNIIQQYIKLDDIKQKLKTVK